MAETELETLTSERNLYKGKYRALLKLIIRTRNKLVQVTDHIEDEGDRSYFGSTNHADDLRELYYEMMDWIWDATDETNRMKSDPYADIRKQRERAKKAEALNERLMARIQWLRDGYREMAKWSPDTAADRTKQYALDTLSGPTNEQIDAIVASRAAFHAKEPANA
jgi:hypothetical protein